jgi:hypothetical protein
MKKHEANTNEARVNTAPLFSSVWLALFNELRQQYIDRRLEVAANTNCSQS